MDKLLEGDGWGRWPGVLNPCPRTLPTGQFLEELVMKEGTCSLDAPVVGVGELPSRVRPSMSRD